MSSVYTMKTINVQVLSSPCSGWSTTRQVIITHGHRCTHRAPCIGRQSQHGHCLTGKSSKSDAPQPSTSQQTGHTSLSQVWTPRLLKRQTLVMFLAGASLGPFLDGMHSSNNVLHYHDPFVIGVGAWQLESCWWVPVLFGVAGAMIGVGVPVVDTLLNQAAVRRGTSSSMEQTLTSPTASTQLAPSWPLVLLCIAMFVIQYGISGRLEQPLMEMQGALDVLLWVYAAVHYIIFDKTLAGMVLSTATALGGPAIEVFLINTLHLYHYEHPDVLGIPTWIAAVYFAGGPAVGNLGRRVCATLLEFEQAQSRL